MRRGEVAVAEGHSQRFVSDQFLDRQEVHPSHRQPGAEGVPQVVKVEILELRLLEGRIPEPTEVMLKPTSSGTEHIGAQDLSLSLRFLFRRLDLLSPHLEEGGLH